MGDRVLIVCHAGPTDIAPAVYAHWAGSDAPDILVAAGEAGILREGDSCYTAARVAWAFCNRNPDSCRSVGLMHSPPNLEPETFDFDGYGPGDAGAILLDVRDGSLSYYGGYLCGPDDEIERPSHVKMKAE